MLVTFQSHFGPAQADPKEVICVTKKNGEPVTVRLKGGKLITSDGPAKTVGNALNCFCWAQDNDGEVGFAFDQVVSKTQTAAGLRVELPESVFVLMPDMTEQYFDYGKACSEATRAGRPIPTPPPGLVPMPK